jgi:hypothetical protein
MEETVVTGRKANTKGDPVKRKVEPTAIDEEAEIKATQEWLLTVDKPLVSKVEERTEHEKGDPVEIIFEEKTENSGAEIDRKHSEVPESTPKEILDLLAEIDREYFQDN